MVTGVGISWTKVVMRWYVVAALLRLLWGRTAPAAAESAVDRYGYGMSGGC